MLDMKKCVDDAEKNLTNLFNRINEGHSQQYASKSEAGLKTNLGVKSVLDSLQGLKECMVTICEMKKMLPQEKDNVV
jgi:hypothetical protein